MNKIKNLFLNNNIIIGFVFLVFLKPYFMCFNSSINTITNIFLIVFSINIYLLYLHDFKFSKFQILVILFLLSSLISTIFVSKDILSWIKYFIKFSSISIYSEMLIKKNLNKFLISLSSLLFFMIIITFFTTVIFPKGIFGFEILFLGYDNSTITLLIGGSMFVLFSSFFNFNKKRDIIYLLVGFIPLFMTCIIYLLTWSVGALIGCTCILILLLFYILFMKFNFLKHFFELFNLKKLFIISFFIFVGIVFFDIQKYFSYIIVDIFKKDLTITNRVYIWETCISYIKRFPIFGTGIFDYNLRLKLYGIYHAHSNFLNIIFESGLIGLFLYSILWFSFIKSINISKNNNLKFVVISLMFSYLIMTTIDVIENNELIFVFFTICYYLPYISEKSYLRKYDSKKKILFLVDTGQPIPAVNGGAIETLVDSLISYNKNYYIDVYSSYVKGVENVKNKYSYVNYNYINKKSFFSILFRTINFGFRKIFKKDIISFFSFFVLDDIERKIKFEFYDYVIIENTPLIITKLNKTIKSKYILHVHNDIDNLNYSLQSLELYHKIICCSNYISNRMENISSNKNIVTVYNGINVNEIISFNNYREILREKYNIPKDAIIYGYCGRICSDKGTMELIKSFKKICSNNENIYLVLTGNSFFKNSKITPYIESLLKLSKGLEDKIIFTGYFDHSEIGKFYSLIDVYVQPSIVNEACPLTIIEAQMMNKIVITTNSGGIPELLINKNTFVIDRKNLQFNLYNKMLYVLNNYDSLSLVKNNKRILDEFNDKYFSKNFFENINFK